MADEPPGRLLRTALTEQIASPTGSYRLAGEGIVFAAEWFIRPCRPRRKHMRVAVCLYVKDAVDMIAEWISYHSAIGVDHFIIYDNMSLDGTSDVIAQCSALYPITTIKWNVLTKYAHFEAYEHCIRTFRFVFDWIIFIDTDEFFLPVRDGSAKAFLATMPHASAIACCWAMFGSSGRVDAPDGLMIDAFTARAPDDFGPNRHTKMIVRPHLVRHIHASHYFQVDGPTVSPNGSEQQWESPGLAAGVPDVSICRINHYFTRSRSQWNKKIERGYRDILRSEQEFSLYDRNEVKDDIICRYSPEVKAGLARVASIPFGFGLDMARGALDAFAKGSVEWQALPATAQPILHAPCTEELVVDPVWYAENNLDVLAAGIDALMHFWTYGILEDRDPNPFFDTLWYRQTYPEVGQYHRPPFVHFVEVGARTGLRPNGRLPFTRPWK